MNMEFADIFEFFVERKDYLKVVSVASCDLKGKPNSAPKMLVDIQMPNVVLFLDYRFTVTFSNLKINSQLSISFMDDANFTGYRLAGTAHVLKPGPELEAAQTSWEKRLISYEAERMIKRMKGHFSTKQSESLLPKDFVITKFLAKEASIVKPDRVFKAYGR